MDAVSVLNEHLDVVKLLEHYQFDKVRYEGNVVRACCKLHGGNNPTAFAFHPEKKVWYCHTSDCGGGDAFTLIQRLEDCSFKEAVVILADILGIDIHNMEIKQRTEDHVKELNQWLKLMKARQKERHKPFQLNVPIKKVTKLRDFKPETLQYFQCGYVDEMMIERKDGTYYKLEKRLCIPITQDGVQIGVSLRRTRAKDAPKWLHQPRNIKTSELLYNYDNVIGEPIIVITEGIFDVWAFHEIDVPAVATYGAHVTKEQYKHLIKSGADLVFAFDGDDAGRSAMKKAMELFKYTANVSYIDFADGEDPENISRDELKLKYEGRVR